MRWWYFKDHKARNRNHAHIDSKGDIKVTIPLITRGNVECKINAIDLITAEGREERMNKITMISDRLIDPVSRITLPKQNVADTCSKGNVKGNAKENTIKTMKYAISVSSRVS